MEVDRIDENFLISSGFASSFPKIGKLDGREVVPIQAPLPFSIEQPIRQVEEPNVRTSFMSSCSKITIEIYAKDDNGNIIGIKGEFEGGNDSDSSEVANSDDQDFDKD